LIDLSSIASGLIEVMQQFNSTSRMPQTKFCLKGIQTRGSQNASIKVLFQSCLIVVVRICEILILNQFNRLSTKLIVRQLRFKTLPIYISLMTCDFTHTRFLSLISVKLSLCFIFVFQTTKKLTATKVLC